MKQWWYLGAVLSVLLCGNASAQHQQKVDQIVARKHFELGAQLYKTSNYQQALIEFSKAYELSKKPALLFNIARCHEVMANLEEAVKFYRHYLEQVPTAPNRSLVESRLRNLQNVLAARRAKDKPAPGPKKPTPPEPKKDPTPDDPSLAPPPVVSTPAPLETQPAGTTPSQDGPPRWKHTTGWIALGTGGALLVTGIVFGGMAAGKTDDYKEAARTTPYDQLGELREEGEALESTQIGLMVAGGVLAAAGGALLLWQHMGRRKKDEPDTVAVVAPLVTGSAVGLRGRLQF